MQSQEEKLSLFIKAINDYAEKQRLRILYEMDEQSSEALSRAEKEALSDAYRLIQRETADVRGSIATELSSRELAGRRKLFEQRVAIEKKIFDEAAAKLRQFAASKEYDGYLEKAAASARKAFDAAPDGTVFRLRPSDMERAGLIEKAYGAKCEFAADESIHLGGLLAMNGALGVALDVTLDARLEDQHEWFCERAELTVV